MIYPKIIRGYKATPHKIVRNIDGEWYESRPTKEIWPSGCGEIPDPATGATSAAVRSWLC
jgi:hypothetical protein